MVNCSAPVRKAATIGHTSTASADWLVEECPNGRGNAL